MVSHKASLQINLIVRAGQCYEVMAAPSHFQAYLRKAQTSALPEVCLNVCICQLHRFRCDTPSRILDIPPSESKIVEERRSTFASNRGIDDAPACFCREYDSQTRCWGGDRGKFVTFSSISVILRAFSEVLARPLL